VHDCCDGQAEGCPELPRASASKEKETGKEDEEENRKWEKGKSRKRGRETHLHQRLEQPACKTLLVRQRDLG
jgi:hypothetical protein